MTREEIQKNLDGLLSNPKSKNFINHLVRSYFPTSKVSKVMVKPDGVFKCVLSKDDLISVEEALTIVNTEEYTNLFNSYLKTMFDEKIDNSGLFKELIGAKKLGVTGSETTTFMSYPTFIEFTNWVVTKSLNGDKHINWLLGPIRKETNIKKTHNVNDTKIKKKISLPRKNNVEPATFTLGDSSDILLKLKQDLEKKGK